MRVLVIENDPQNQSALEAALKNFKDREKASDRSSALDLIQHSLADNRWFDLVVVDIDTPGMQDDSIIADIRQIEDNHHVPEEKKACLIVISASPRRQLLTDCMFRGCDEFMDKPLDSIRMLENLNRFNLTDTVQPAESSLLKRVTGKTLFDGVIKKIERGDLELPPSPKIAMRTRQLVDLNADIEDVIDLFRHDLSISTKLIRLSNSVAYGGFEKNTSTSQAVRRIGIDRSVDVVMSICCRGYFVTNHPDYKQLVENLWWHSLACAHAMTNIIDHKQLNIDEDPFALGLLHDIGKLVLIQAAGDLQRPKKWGMDIEMDALRSILSEYHGQVGMRILKKWGYSKAFAALIQHHRVSGETEPPAAMQMLYEANQLATVAGFSDGMGNIEHAAEQLEQLGYIPALQDDLKKQLSTQIEQLRYAFG